MEGIFLWTILVGYTIFETKIILAIIVQEVYSQNLVGSECLSMTYILKISFDCSLVTGGLRYIIHTVFIKNCVFSISSQTVKLICLSIFA